jgi:hypothetical protein
MKTVAAFLWRYFLGALFTLTPITAILVVGWTQRSAARTVARRWETASGPARSDASEHRAWPRWIMAEDAPALLGQARRSGPLRAPALVARALFGSLAANAYAGIRALIPIAIVMAPAGLLWLFSWWAGWDNSFNKGYEQSSIGPSLAFAGIAYFMVAMTLLPLAEMRQAVNDSWSAFFDIRFLRRAAREVQLGLIALGALFVTAGFAVAALKVAPLGLGNSVADPADLRLIAERYPLLVAALLFPLYVALRLTAARIYARATLRLASKGITAFAARERTLLEQFGVNLSEPAAATTAIRGIAAGGGALVSTALASAVMFAIWFGFAGEFYVSQFLVHDWMHWINHPLIQLPWTGSIFWPR